MISLPFSSTCHHLSKVAVYGILQYVPQREKLLNLSYTNEQANGACDAAQDPGRRCLRPRRTSSSSPSSSSTGITNDPTGS